MNRWICLALCCALAVATLPAVAVGEMQTGTPDIKSAGPLVFGPNGILFIGDAESAAVFAIDTKDTQGYAGQASLNVDGIDAKVAALLGTTAQDITINDLAVNPASDSVYMSVSRGRGPDAQPVILKVSPQGEITQFALQNVSFDKAELPNAPENAVTGQGRGARNNRTQSITDLAFADGQLFIAGLSNEEFASKLRTVPYPFQRVDAGASIEIFHTNHDALETRSPVRTFAAYSIGDAPHLLAAYTCTPLVRIPVASLNTSGKVVGETVAELGNRNTPLDMVIYQKDGKDYALMANDRRGVMKIALENVGSIGALTQRVDDTAGLPFETLGTVEGVVQLDRLNETLAVILVDNGAGGLTLSTIPLP